MQPIHRLLLYGGILLIGLLWIFASADRTQASTAGHIPAPQKGFLAPQFTLATPDGTQYSISAFKGKAVLLNIWATWCPPCRAEMPTIEKMYQEYQGQGLVVLGMNSTVQDNPLDILPFVTQYGLSFPVLLDETGEVGKKYNLHLLPTSFFINRDGTIAEVVVGGPMSEALLQTNIEEILHSRAD